MTYRRPTKVTGFLFLIGCGSRTPFEVTEGPPPPPECVKDADCETLGDLCSPIGCIEGKCSALTPVDCDDHDDCTADECDSATGICVHGPATADLDHDGHRAPLPGKRAGDPGSCGDDCDDTDPTVYPGAPEVCGRDNDCDGVIDPVEFEPSGDGEQVSRETEAYAASLERSPAGFMASYSGRLASHDAVYLATLGETGAVTNAPAAFTLTAADAYGGPLRWTGDRFGLAWSDRRDARGNAVNYEIYFNLVNPDGSKRLPDVRLTNADGFSLYPSLAWTGVEFVVAWQDDGMNARATNEIFAQRIDIEGSPIGGNVKLVDAGSAGQTSPVIAAGARSLGLVWLQGSVTSHQLMFVTLDYALRPTAAVSTLAANMTAAVHPVIVRDASQYLVAWYDPDSAEKTVYGAVRDELGNEIVAARPLVQTPGHARYPSLLPFGDRVLLVWSDDRDNNLGYELYSATLDQKLEMLTSPTRLTHATGDSVDAVAAQGPKGGAGILFDDDRTGSSQVYFLGLDCVPATP